MRNFTLSEKMFSVLNYLLLGILAFITIYPFIYIAAVSFSSTAAIANNEVTLFPIGFNLSTYTTLIKEGQLILSLKNTVIITVFGTIFNMLMTIITGYALSRKRLMGRQVVMGLMVFTMMFNAGLIPNFILMKELNLINSFGSLWILSLISVYNTIIMKNFFSTIPESLEEAGKIDGASDFYILFRVMIPLSMPAIATLTLFYAVGWWNDYFNAMIYLSKPDKFPMTVKLMQMVNNISDSLLRPGESALEQGSAMTPQGIKAAAIIITSVPILCVYPFLQKYFVKGVMVGSVKG